MVKIENKLFRDGKGRTIRGRVGLFIDQANIWDSQKRIGSMIDMEKLCIFIERELNSDIVYKAMYFAYPEEGTRDYNVDGIHKWGTFLHKKLGFKIVKKPIKRIKQFYSDGSPIIDEKGAQKILEKGNLDIELAIDVVRSYHSYDYLVLLSGDSDYLCLLHLLKNNSKNTFVFSTEGNISTELKHGCDKYYDLGNISEILGNKIFSRKRKTPA